MTKEKLFNEELNPALNKGAVMHSAMPCPFCGDKPTLSIGDEHSFIGGWSNEVRLRCCVTMSVAFGDYAGNETTQDQATDELYQRWNVRHCA